MINNQTNKFLEEIHEKIPNHSELYEQFVRCYNNTLQKTIKQFDDNSVHIITGDIPAMWLRDSTAQIRPYIFEAKHNEQLKNLILGVIKRQFFYINIDAYANAFNESPNGACWEKDDPNQNPWVWERKFEIDSLCYPIQLAYLLWKNTGCISQFDSNLKSGILKILEVFYTELNHEGCSHYKFERKSSYFSDTLSREGKGTLVKPNIGLIWSGFRPSDDSCVYGYLIPSNMFAVVVLGYIEEIAASIWKDATIINKASSLKKTVHNAIEKFGITNTEEFGEIYAYEVDGYGMFNLMDDANVPSLLSIPYLGYPANENVLKNTRNMILSDANPYFYKGQVASGIGSSHTPTNCIWPIAIAMQGLTSSSEKEKLMHLQILHESAKCNGMMHESFNVNNPSCYTREWFSWANAMYVELFLNYLGYELVI